jgi:2-iminobutanoate/2-iminopropanoate deaminase
MTTSIVFSNPELIHAPSGAYSHGVLVPAQTNLLFIAGQIGVRPDGSLGKNIHEQADQIFLNILAVLHANEMDYTDIVKMTTYVVAGQPGADVGAARRKHFGLHRPTATFFYVSQLYAPEWFVEIDAIAAKV